MGLPALVPYEAPSLLEIFLQYKKKTLLFSDCPNIAIYAPSCQWDPSKTDPKDAELTKAS